MIRDALGDLCVLAILDVLFFALHSLLIVFNLTGWAWRRTRPLHLLTLGLTIFSWIVLGAFLGWGYCLCTDWHFQIRRQLGYYDPETSYIQLLIRRVVGAEVTRGTADFLAVGGLAAIIIATAVMWARDCRTIRQPNSVHA
jgi:Protein of Unknown function (DUF2784)